MSETIKNINIGDKLKSAGVFISENKKPLLYVGGAIAVVALGYVLVNRFNQGLKNGLGGLFKDNSKGSTAFVPAEVDNSKASITDSVANAYSNQLYDSMKNWGTDVNTIYAILKKIEKKEDFRKVYNAFGRRSYYINGSPTISAYVFGYDDLDLIEWFRKEVGLLNPITYYKIKEVVNNAGFAY